MLEGNPDWRVLSFALHHVVDCLVTFGLRDQGNLVLHLANLLFSVLLRHEAFAPFLTIAEELKRLTAKRRAKQLGTLQRQATEGDMGMPFDEPAHEAPKHPMLPWPLAMIVLQLRHLMSLLPDASANTVRDIRMAEQDLRR